MARDCCFHFLSWVRARIAAARGEKADPRAVLERLKSSGLAFAVFEKKTERDKVLRLASLDGSRTGTLEYTTSDGKKYDINVQVPQDEPASINWENISRRRDPLILRALRCALIITLAIIIWSIFIYGPYGYYAYMNLTNGVEPDPLTDFGFSTFVVGGNLGIYVLCEYLADGARPISVAIATTRKRSLS